MSDRALVVAQGQNLGLALFSGRLHLLEQEGLTAGLDANDEMHAVCGEIGKVWGVAAERVFDNDHGQTRMFASEVLQETAAGIAFAIVLGLPVLFDDGLGTEGDDFAQVGVDQAGSEHLMGIGDFAVAAFLLQAPGTMNFFRGEIGGAVQSHQVMALKKDERFEGFATLELTKERGERRPNLARLDLVEDSSRLRVRGNVVDAKKRLEIGRIALSLHVKSQERGRFERKDGEARHQSVAQGNSDATATTIDDLLEFRANQPIEVIGR